VTNTQTGAKSNAANAVGVAGVPFAEALRTYARIAILSFGGPAGQIAVMHRIFVEEKNWIGETRFLHALNYCMLLPGPEAHELVIYVGWLLHRIRGGVAAGVLFVLPGLVTLGLLSWIYSAFGQIGIVQAAFFGLKAAVLAVVLDAVIRIGRRSLKSSALIATAVAAFVGIFVFKLPFPLLIAAAAALGFLGSRIDPSWFTPTSHGDAGKANEAPTLIDRIFADGVPEHVRPSMSRFARVALIGGAIWLAPLIALLVSAGPDNVFTNVALFNSKMAVVTFGGAYAVLAYMAQQAVEHYHWLKPGEMLIGLGFAETTPGPLISVVQFVGYMAAFRQPGTLAPAFAGTLGGVLAMWSTFVPPFIWIFAGGPYVEAIIGNRSLGGALSAIAAAVVGVILNLAVWFSLHVIFGTLEPVRTIGMQVSLPVLSSVNWRALILSIAAAIAIFRFRIGMIAVLGTSCLAGTLWYLASGTT
jgi:chromate transporter